MPAVAELVPAAARASVPPSSRRPRIGVALGGGSARGYAHIGVLAALERRGFAPDVVVGTSFGAVIGALYAVGHTPAQLRRDAEGLRRRDVLPRIVDLGLDHGALFAGHRLEAYFRNLVGDARIEDLPRTLAVVTTDVDTGEIVVLRRGPLAKALRASASLPGVFAPVPWEGRRLVDGGIGAPVPLSTLDGFGVDLALGVGAGVEVRDSRGLRVARAAVRSGAGRWVRRWLGGRASPHGAAGDAADAAIVDVAAAAVAAAVDAAALDGATVDRATVDGEMLDGVVVAFAAVDAAAVNAGAVATLGRALALTLDAWGTAENALPDGADGAVHVQTRPPIHWLRFDRAADAIAAGDAAMETAWPGVGRRLAALGGG